MANQFTKVLALLCCLWVVHSENCPEIPLKFDNAICSCGIPSEVRDGGWERTCWGEAVLVDQFKTAPVLYKLTYLISKKLQFDCNYNRNITFRDDLFENVEMKDSTKLEIVKCPIPNKSLNRLVEKFNLTSLRFGSNDDDLEDGINENFLAGMVNLETFILEFTGIYSLPETFFSNATKLKSLKLYRCKLKSLPENLFAFTPNLKKIDLGDNELETLPEKLFHGLKKLYVVHLQKNKLTSISPTLFEGLKELVLLDMGINRLTSLPTDVFRDLISLKQLGLNKNNFSTLPSKIFRNNTKLTAINFSKIPFRSMPVSLFKGLNRLNDVSFTDCNITNFPDDFFYHASNLTSLKLYNNRLRNISRTLLSRNSRLKKLELPMNSLSVLDEFMFRGLFNLKELQLHHNNISIIMQNALKDMVSLEKISISNNKLTTLDYSLFNTNLKLTSINLNHNKLFINDSFMHFSHLKKLERLDLSYNRLISEPYLKLTISIKTVDLKYNNISVITPGFDVSPRVRYNLIHNNIKKIDMTKLQLELKNQKLRTRVDFLDDKKTAIYYISHNPIICDCEISEFLKYKKETALHYLREFQVLPVQFKADNLICAEPKQWKGKRLIELEPNEPTCSEIWPCPINCLCEKYQLNNSKSVSCINNPLSFLPMEIPHNTSILNLRNSSLNEKQLMALKNEIFSNVTQLFLSHNQIRKFTKDIMLPKLKVLDLQGNKLELIPDWLPKYSNGNDITYFLSNNPWICNCSAISLKSWLTQYHERIKDVEKIMCLKDDRRYNLLDLTDDELCPVNISYAFLASIITSTVILFIVIIVFVIIYYKQRQNVMIFLFTHNLCQFFFKEDDIDEDKVFDAFISYSYHNRDFVIEQLVPELEDKEPRYNLCIHERNFMPGKSIVENIINAIELSRRTVIILSNDFVESEWGMLEFTVAHHQMLKDYINRVVIVVMDELSEKAKSVKELQFFLSTKTYLKRDELWFWDKLRYTLPRRPLSISKNGPQLVLPNMDQQKKLKPKIDEIKEEINEKVAKRLVLPEKNGTLNNIIEKKLENLINPMYIPNENVNKAKQTVIQMQPTNKIEMKPVAKINGVKENLV